jgi:uncharacterized protein (TIGR03083 family)
VAVARPTTYDEIRAALAAQYDVLVAAFAELDPAGPTDCEGWTVATLQTHIAITARGLTRIVDGVDGPASGGVKEWSQKVPELAEQADATAKDERLRLADHVEPAVAALHDAPADRVVEQLTGRHTLRDAAMFRLIEAVVHGLDAAIEPDKRALAAVTKELAQLLADRHPGHSVEVRIPPYAAVQCVEGPRHTRGTPPNVVEADPVSFLRLVTGRASWATLVAGGRVRASGERSDLSGLVPLLG